MRASRFLTLLCFAASVTATAATVPALDLPALIAGSTRIVHGKVVRTWAGWDSSKSYIWTHYEIRVDESLRGGSHALVVSTPGGTIDGLTMHVPGAARFDVGEEAVVFAYQAPNGLWRLRGWGQGKYRVETSGGRRTVRSSAGDLRILPPPDRKSSVAASTVRDLGGFLQAVRRLAEPEGR